MARARRVTTLLLAASMAAAGEALRQIQEARALGVDGVLLFSYDSLVSPVRGPDNLTRIGAEAFGQQGRPAPRMSCRCT